MLNFDGTNICKVMANTLMFAVITRWSVAMHFAPGSAGVVLSSGVQCECEMVSCCVVLFYNRKGYVFGLKFLIYWVYFNWFINFNIYMERL